MLFKLKLCKRHNSYGYHLYYLQLPPPPPVIGVRLILQKVGQNFLPLDLDLYLFAVVSFILSKIAAILDKINVERPPRPSEIHINDGKRSALPIARLHP